jgi:methyl-accepting chemotaxis protein
MSAIKLKYAIFGVVLLMLGLFVAQGLLGLSKLSSCNDNVTNLATNWLPSVSVTNELNTNTSDLRIAEGAHILSTDDAAMTAAETDISELERTIEKNRKIYEPLISSPEERARYQEFVRKWDAYMQLHGRLLQLSRKNENEAAAALFKGEMAKLFNAASDDLLKLVELNKAGAKTDYETSQADSPSPASSPSSCSDLASPSASVPGCSPISACRVRSATSPRR